MKANHITKAELSNVAKLLSLLEELQQAGQGRGVTIPTGTQLYDQEDNLLGRIVRDTFGYYVFDPGESDPDA